MIRKIIRIDEEKCTGCAACAAACHEGAIEMVNGKAKLTKENHCDGLGDCLPACPADAISFEEREAPTYDEAAVQASRLPKATAPYAPYAASGTASGVQSQLTQWPVQLKLVPAIAPFFHQAKLLIAADCTAYAYGNFHNDFIRDHVTVIGCPKLDEGDYTEKLTAIFSNNDIQSISVVRMEVPCCGGLERAVIRALEASGKDIPCKVTVIRTNGSIR